MVDKTYIQTNLILSSLYLSAFEILKAAILDSVALFFVIPSKPDKDFISSLKNELSEEDFKRIYEANIGRYEEQVNEYNREVNANYETRDRYGLKESSKWLLKVGVFSEEDVATVEKLKEHRNQVAHKLHDLVISKDSAISIERLEQAVNLLKKVGPFLARIDADVPDTISDEEIVSGREMALGMIWDAAVDTLNQLNSA